MTAAGPLGALASALPRLDLGVTATTAALVAAVVVGLVVAIEARGDGTPARRAARAATRSLVLLAVAAALAGPRWRGTSTPPGTLVLLVDDASRATPAGRAATDALVARARAATDARGTTLRLVPFGATPRAATPRAEETPRPAPPGPPTERSRLAPALAVAGLVAPTDAAAAVLVATDGRADVADVGAARAALDARAIPTRTVVVPPPAPADVAPATRLDAFDAPAEARGPIAVRAALATERPATVRLIVDGVERDRRDVAPPAAEVVFDGLVLPPGLHEVAVVIDGVEDPAAAARRTLVRVAAPTRALLVAAAPEAHPVRRALSAQGLDVVAVPPADAARALRDERADLVVLDADAAQDVATGLDDLAARVAQGLGLLVVAGRDAEAFAALAQGPLAPLLPLVPTKPPPPPPPPPAPPPSVEPDPAPDPEPSPPEPGPGLVVEKRAEDALPITLLLVIDRSGSMKAERKLALAIAAAEEAAAQLAPTDRVGVVTFSDDATVDVPPRAAGRASTLGLAVGLVAQGNTDIYRALEAAAAVMRAETNPIRHVVLLTDGRDTVSDVYGALPSDLAREGITITTVGLGYSIDERALKDLARQGRGRYLYAPSAQELPRILTRDTRTVLDARGAAAQRARLDERAKAPPTPPPSPPARTPPPKRPPTPPPPPPPAPAAPDVGPLLRRRPHDALAGLVAADLPSVGAPRGGAVAAGAAALLTREDDRPVLVAGRAGLGRVLVFALPADDAGFLAWPLRGRLLAQAARAVAATALRDDALEARVAPTPEGDTVVVSLPEGVDAAAAAAALAVTVDGAGGAVAATALGVEDGEASYRLPAARGPTGVVRIAVRRPDGSTIDAPPLTYVPRPTRAIPPAVDLGALAAATGARPVAADDPGVFDVPPRPMPTTTPLALWLAGFALLLLPFDAWAHRSAPRPARSAP